jgi:uncharacterized protein (TIGR03790 family)
MDNGRTRRRRVCYPMCRIRVVSVLLMLLLSPWIGSIDESEKSKEHFDSIFEGFVVARSDSWNETPFRDIAVEGGFTQTEYMDYSDVGVLINNQSSASRTIGWAFVAARNISLENVLLFDNESTPTGETINRNQFNQYFVEPFREWLNESEYRRTEINYLVTTKGVPLRVSGGDSKVSFDNELALVEGDMKGSIDTDWWVQHSYGPFNGDGFESFTREKHGFFLITRLTGYTVETALGLIEKANNSLGQRGTIVLDLASNRNGSGYKYWNDDLYTANTTLNGSMDLPVLFNQNSTFITNVSDVIAYASWGSNDGSWSQNLLPNGGFDNANDSWSSGAEFWNATVPTLSAGDTFNWSYQTDTKQAGNGAVEASISAVCTAKSGSYQPGILAEYFDNNGVSFNVASMPLLIDRVPDHTRIESNLQYSSSSQAYPGLDNRFKNDWGARFSGLISVPEAGNWTFYLTTDDGSELWMDGQSLIQNYGSHGMREISNSVVLDAGIHDFRIEFFQGGGPHGLQFSWEGPNQSKTFIPASAFTLAGDYVPSASSLLHKWDFEDGSGFFANDSVNSSTNLTLNNMNSTNWRTCADGSCLWYDGVDDSVSVDVDDWVGDFTISQWVWANSTTLPNYASTFAVDDAAGSNGSFQHTVYNGQWRMHSNQTYAFGDVEEQRWTHLVTVFENGTVRQYLDGVNVQSITIPGGSLNNFELYKLGVNRAGSTFFEGMIDNVQVWNVALQDHEITTLHRDIYHDCSSYSGNGQSVASLEQTFLIPNHLDGHVWLMNAYGMRIGDVYGDFTIEADSIDGNGVILSSNTSSSQIFGTSWGSTTLRFQPHSNATHITIRIPLNLVATSTGGSVYLDTLRLYPIRPHNQWVDGSIAETAVSTGARSFEFGTSYGQSLIADLLEDGVSGVKGYVYEPYLTAVAYPSVMTIAYASGYTWAESIYMANPLMSWMGVAVGDPKMAAFADILHDANLTDIRENGTPTQGRTTGLEVIIENLGLAMGNGTLEVRERQGNALVGSINLSLAAGDQTGSRIKVEVPITPKRSGYTEFVVRWVNATGSYERLKDNNVIIINLLVNEPPGVSQASCQSNIVYRGSSFTCSAIVGDDVAVISTDIGWRIRIDDENYTNISWATAGTSDNTTWWTGISIPADSPLGWIELHVISYDNLGFASPTFMAENISEVVDALATWNGPYIEGVDPANWAGVTTLSSNGNGLARGQVSRMKACVLDADHDPTLQVPIFNSSIGVISNFTLLNTSTPSLTCYQANISIENGVPLGPHQISITTEEGSITRGITLANLHPEPIMELRNANNQSIEFSSGGIGESIWLTLNDADDPEGSAYGDLLVKWPGHVDKVVAFEIGIGERGVLIAIPYPNEALEQNPLTVELTLRAAHSSYVETSHSWSVLLSPPTSSGITLCDIEGNQVDWLIRGHPVIASIPISSQRPIGSASARLAQTGWTVFGSQLDDSDFSGLCLSSQDSSHLLRFRVVADSSFMKGEAVLSITFRDLDGLMVQESLHLSIKHAIPSIELTSEDEVAAGQNINIQALVTDLDSVEGTSCTISITDSLNQTVFSHSKQVSAYSENEGIVEYTYPTPKKNSNQNIPPWQVFIQCTDSQGDTGQAELNHSIIAIPIPPCTENCENETAVEQKVSSGFSTQKTIIAVGGGIAILSGIALAFIVGKKKEQEFEEDPWSEKLLQRPTEMSEEELQHHHQVLEEHEESEFSDILDEII